MKTIQPTLQSGCWCWPPLPFTLHECLPSWSKEELCPLKQGMGNAPLGGSHSMNRNGSLWSQPQLWATTKSRDQASGNMGWKQPPQQAKCIQCGWWWCLNSFSLLLILTVSPDSSVQGELCVSISASTPTQNEAYVVALKSFCYHFLTLQDAEFWNSGAASGPRKPRTGLGIRNIYKRVC